MLSDTLGSKLKKVTNITQLRCTCTVHPSSFMVATEPTIRNVGTWRNASPVAQLHSWILCSNLRATVDSLGIVSMMSLVHRSFDSLGITYRPRCTIQFLQWGCTRTHTPKRIHSHKLIKPSSYSLVLPSSYPHELPKPFAHKTEITRCFKFELEQKRNVWQQKKNILRYCWKKILRLLI